MSDKPALLGAGGLVPDPILTDIATDFMTDPGFVYEVCAPKRGVGRRSYKVAKWSFSDGLSMKDKTERAPCAPANECGFPGLSHTDGVLKEYACKDKIAQEHLEEAGNPAALERAKVRNLTSRLRRGAELRFKELLDSGTSSATPGTKWDAGGATIEANIDAAIDAFRTNSGRLPNKIVMPWEVAQVFKRNDDIRALRKFQDDNLLTAGGLPQRIFGMDLVIPEALQNTAAVGAAASIADIWSTDDVYLMHVDGTAAGDPDAVTSVLMTYHSGRSAEIEVMRFPDPHLDAKFEWVSASWLYNFHLIADETVYRLTDVLT